MKTSQCDFIAIYCKIIAFTCARPAARCASLIVADTSPKSFAHQRWEKSWLVNMRKAIQRLCSCVVAVKTM